MKEQAIELRKQGHSLNEICKLLTKSNSTVYRWIKDVPNTNEIKSRRKRNLITGLSDGRKNQYKLARENYDKLGYELYLTNLNFQKLCLLYWCEGTKHATKGGFGFCNTDPVMMKFVVDVLKEIGCLDKQYMYITCHPNSATDEELKVFWGTLAETSNIKIHRKTTSSSQRKNRHHYGICTLIISSTKLSCMVLGCVERIKNQQIHLYQDSSKLNRPSGIATL